MKAKKIFSAFTLVELIVVITIVGILATIGFVSYTSYISSSRDSSRISQLQKLSDSIQTYSAKQEAPLPDDGVEIYLGTGNLLSYQGFVGENVLEAIDYTNGGKDPADAGYYTYTLSKDRKNVQLAGYLEAQSNLTSPTKNTDGKYLKTYGSKVGLVVEKSSGKPVQMVSTGAVDLSGTGRELSVFFESNDYITASGYTLWSLVTARVGEKAPSDCPEGYVGVPGNSEFNTKGFCVPKYEMTYEDANVPNSTGLGSPPSNTVHYVPGKKLVSIPGKYPVADIQQETAVAACKDMGAEYHLLNNNEWMTIARNAESVGKNWSSGIVGEGFMYNGVSGDTTLGCDSTGGNTELRARGTKTGPGQDANCNERRKITLSNGVEIWDLAGNFWEHVNKDSSDAGTGYNSGTTSVLVAPSNTSPSASGAYTSPGGSPIYWDEDGLYAPADMKKYGSAFFYGKSNGMGTIAFAQGISNNTFIRGVTGSDGDKTGIYGIDLQRYESRAVWGPYVFITLRCTKFK